ncbi:M17 family peptidase N-terminal domain-containing protein, partial [Microbacterium sp. UBA6741]
MTLPVLSHTTAQFPGSAADAAVLVVAALPDSADSLAGYPGLADALAGIGFTGSAGSFARVYAPEVTSLPLAVVGVGNAPDPAAVRNATGTALRTLAGFEHVAIALADGLESFAVPAAEGAVLGGHKFDGYRTEKGKARATTITLHAALDDEDAEHAQVLGDAVALVKDLVNVPAEWQSPAQLAQSAADSVADLDVTVEILDEKDLADQGFGGILGVGQGSDRPPRLVRLDYSPADASR